MHIKLITLICICSMGNITFAQPKTTSSAIIKFDASTPIDDLPKAENTSVVAALDVVKGTVAFEAVIRNFQFSNPKMQEHFNGKKWMNSAEFPKASFEGVIKNISKINFNKNGTYPSSVEGNLSMHGKINKITAPITIIVSENNINTKSEFSIPLENYNITGSAINAGEVAKEPKIFVSATFN